ncbi:MAG: hypothetical protein JWM44_2401 [Bacilli bacterium]|nr:hypothetical protein [Bacilli bacterium]
MKLHRLSIVVGEGKSEVFYREFTCNATHDYYILPKDKRVKKSALEKIDVHGVTHERYYAAVWLFDEKKLKEFSELLRKMAIEHFESCAKLAKEAYDIAQAQTVYPQEIS